MTFPYDKIESSQIGGQIKSLKNITERQKEVLQLINIDNKISRLKMSKKLNINESAIQKHLNYLKEKGYLERIDGSRGYWKINLKK